MSHVSVYRWGYFQRGLEARDDPPWSKEHHPMDWCQEEIRKKKREERQLETSISFIQLSLCHDGSHITMSSHYQELAPLIPWLKKIFSFCLSTIVFSAWWSNVINKDTKQIREHACSSMFSYQICSSSFYLACPLPCHQIKVNGDIYEAVQFWFVYISSLTEQSLLHSREGI